MNVLCWPALLAPLALAAELPAPDPALPVLVLEAAATYPPAALAAGTEASVLVELDVDANGAVVAARVVEPAGDGFDEAAAGRVE